jgi:hypothetical protein
VVKCEVSNYRVLISDCIIRNEDGIQINSKEFQLYYYLKILHDKQKSNVVSLNHNQYMSKFGIKSNSTFKKLISQLYKNNLINNIVEELPKQSLIHIEMNKDYIQKQPFTLIHINLYYLINKVSYQGLRLMYYHESRINRNIEGNKCSYAGIRTIVRETKINHNQVIEYHDKLSKLKLLKVDVNDLSYTGTYDEFTQEIKTKYTNKYYPQLSKIEKYNFTGNGK